MPDTVIPLSEPLAQDILSYLVERPYKEVYTLIPRLMAASQSNTAPSPEDVDEPLIGTDVAAEMGPQT